MARNHLIVPEEAALATIERMDEEALAAEMDRVIRYVEARTGWLFGLTAQEMVDATKRGIRARLDAKLATRFIASDQRRLGKAQGQSERDKLPQKAQKCSRCFLKTDNHSRL